MSDYNLKINKFNHNIIYNNVPGIPILTVIFIWFEIEFIFP
jgi:hypothetical protein